MGFTTPVSTPLPKGTRVPSDLQKETKEKIITYLRLTAFKWNANRDWHLEHLLWVWSNFAFSHNAVASCRETGCIIVCCQQFITFPKRDLWREKLGQSVNTELISVRYTGTEPTHLTEKQNTSVVWFGSEAIISTFTWHVCKIHPFAKLQKYKWKERNERR